MAAEHTPLRGDYLVELRLQPLNEVIGVERERETRVLLLAELACHRNIHTVVRDSMETLLRQEREARTERKRPTKNQCHRARVRDWSMCEGSRIMGATARLTHGWLGKPA